jgi:alpha-N-acetylglucosaminidase
MLRMILLLWLPALVVAATQSVQGIVNLVERRLPGHASSFQFSLASNSASTNQSKALDEYTVSSHSNGKILVQGTSLSALSIGYESPV